MCAREAVVWGIICLPSWTKVASCLHDGLKRTQWDVDFKNPLGNFGVPEEVKSSLRPQINIFLFIYLFFQSKALRADFEDTFTLIRKNSLATTEGWLIRLTLTCVFHVSRYTVRNAQVAKAELWIDTWLKSAAKLGTRVVWNAVYVDWNSARKQRVIPKKTKFTAKPTTRGLFICVFIDCGTFARVCV